MLDINDYPHMKGLESIEPIKAQDAPQHYSSGFGMTKIIEDFVASPEECIKIKFNENSLGNYTSNAYQYIKRHKLPIEVIRRKGNIYMVKTELLNVRNDE